MKKLFLKNTALCLLTVFGSAGAMQPSTCIKFDKSFKPQPATAHSVVFPQTVQPSTCQFDKNRMPHLIDKPATARSVAFPHISDAYGESKNLFLRKLLLYTEAYYAASVASVAVHEGSHALVGLLQGNTILDFWVALNPLAHFILMTMPDTFFKTDNQRLAAVFINKFLPLIAIIYHMESNNMVGGYVCFSKQPGILTLLAGPCAQYLFSEFVLKKLATRFQSTDPNSERAIYSAGLIAAHRANRVSVLTNLLPTSRNDGALALCALLRSVGISDLRANTLIKGITPISILLGILLNLPAKITERICLRK